MVFLSYSVLIPEHYPKLDYREILSKNFQFFIHYRVVVPNYIAGVIASVVK